MGSSTLKSVLWYILDTAKANIDDIACPLSNFLVGTFSVDFDQFSGRQGYCNVLLIQLVITVGLTAVYSQKKLSLFKELKIINSYDFR